jgi:hypothetical protein
MNPMHLLPALIAQTGEVVDDPSSQRVVNAVVVGLVLAGLIVIAVTVWFWRSTRPDHEALGRLELMSGRRFGRLSDDEARRQHLDAVRGEAGVAEGQKDGIGEDDSVPLPRPEVSGDQPIDPLLRPSPPVR